MADNVQTQQENVRAYVDGVNATASANPNTKYTFVTSKPPEGTSEYDHIGVEDGHNGEPLKVRIPGGGMNLREVFSNMAGVGAENFKREIPGTAADFYREIGQHEGGHLVEHGDDVLKNEILGDRHAYNGDNPAVEEAYRDARKLSSIIYTDHATSPGLPSKQGDTPPNVNTAKMYGAAQNFRDMVVSDLMGRELIKGPDELKGFQEKNPQAIYNSVKSLMQGGAFDDGIDSAPDTRVSYLRQYAKDYLEASEKWVKGAEAAAPVTPRTSAPTISAPSGP